MKKLAFVLVVFGSGLTALGFSGWQMIGQTRFAAPDAPSLHWDISAGWTLLNQVEMTVGVMLLVCGLLLRRESN